jgi:hypothetical protein
VDHPGRRLRPGDARLGLDSMCEDVAALGVTFTAIGVVTSDPASYLFRIFTVRFPPFDLPPPSGTTLPVAKCLIHLGIFRPYALRGLRPISSI